MEAKRLADLVDQISEYLDPTGMTLEQAFLEIEDGAPHVRVFWGCWTEDELQTIIE